MGKEKEDEFERLEDGDIEDEDFGFVDLKAKVADKKLEAAKEDEATLDGPPNKDDDDDETHLIEGGDDFKGEEEGADLEWTGDKKDEDEDEDKEDKEDVKDVKPEPVKAEVKEPTAEQKADEETKEDMIKYLDEHGGTKYIIKGKEYDLRDLSAQEIKDRFSKAGRFYERMEEVAVRERTMEETQRQLNRQAENVQRLMDTYTPSTKKEPAKAEIPAALKEDSMDSDDVAALKQVARDSLQREADTKARMDNLEQVSADESSAAREDALINAVESLKKEFPLLSEEEVVTVKALYPHVSLRAIAERSHQYYGGDEYFDKVLEARPEKLRELEEKAVEKHLAKKTKATKVSRKRSSTTVSSKASSSQKKMPTTFDEIEEREDEIKKGYKEFLKQLNE